MSSSLKAHERKPGLWEAKGIDPASQRRKSYYGKTPEEAVAKARASFRTDDESLNWFYLNVYFPTIAMRSRNYRVQVAWAFDQHLSPGLGHLPMSEIDRPRLQKHFNSIGLAPGSMRIIRAIAHSIFKLAEDDGVILKNVAAGIRIAEEVPGEDKAISAADLWRLYENGEILRPFILLTGFAGLRQGEALGSSFAKMKADVLDVSQQVQKVKGGTVVSPKLKTPTSYREIPLPFLEELGQKRIWICDENEKYMSPGMSDYYLRRLCRTLGMDPIGPHALRHTFITILENELECPRRIVQALVGHRGKEITDGYSKVSMEAKRRWMQAYWEHISTSVRQGLVVQSASGNLN
jgi:integrase